MITNPAIALWIALTSATVAAGGAVVLSHHDATTKEAILAVPVVESPYDGCTTCTLQARQIAWSLDNQTDQWASDPYRAHRRDVWIWIANNEYGMQVDKDDGVSPQGFGWVPSEADRTMIFAAYLRWKDRVSLHAADIHP